MTQDVLPERIRREYREVPDADFDVDSIVRAGRVRARRRRTAHASGLVAAVAAGVLALGPGLGLGGPWSSTGLLHLSGDAGQRTASVNCLTQIDLADCEQAIRAWSVGAGVDLSGVTFFAHPAHTPGSFAFEVERDRPGSTTIRDLFQVVVTPGPVDGPQGFEADPDNPPVVSSLTLSDGSVAQVEDTGGMQHLREVRLPARPGRAGVEVTMSSFVPTTKVPTGQPDRTTPLPDDWDDHVHRLLEALIARS